MFLYITRDEGIKPSSLVMYKLIGESFNYTACA